MNYFNIAQLSVTQTLVAKCVAEFNPIFTISADGKAICLNGQPFVAKDKSVFGNGKLINDVGIKILNRVVDDIEHDEHSISITHKMAKGITKAVNPMLDVEKIKTLFSFYSDEQQHAFANQCGFIEAHDRFFDVMTSIIEREVKKYNLENSNDQAIVSWFNEAMDQDFIITISKGLRFNRLEDYAQYFIMAESKDVLIAFLAKYPQMIAMLRPIWEAHEAEPQREIFSQFKTLADIEKGEFLVERYNQDYRHYNYSDSSQKFLCDAQSWQWLLSQPQKIIDIIFKLYTVNDNGKSKFAYHSFGRTRENLSLIAHLNIDTKLAEIFLKNMVSDSLEYDRFAIFINRDSEILQDADFHSGEKYRREAKKVFEYLDSKQLSLDEKIKFFKTLSSVSGDIIFLMNIHLWYIKVHKKSELLEVEILDSWVLEKLSKVKKVTKSTYVHPCTLKVA